DRQPLRTHRERQSPVGTVEPGRSTGRTNRPLLGPLSAVSDGTAQRRRARHQGGREVCNGSSTRTVRSRGLFHQPCLVSAGLRCDGDSDLMGTTRYDSGASTTAQPIVSAAGGSAASSTAAKLGRTAWYRRRLVQIGRRVSRWLWPKSARAAGAYAGA